MGVRKGVNVQNEMIKILKELIKVLFKTPNQTKPILSRKVAGRRLRGKEAMLNTRHQNQLRSSRPN